LLSRISVIVSSPLPPSIVAAGPVMSSLPASP
jgi:hypothetical protein